MLVKKKKLILINMYLFIYSFIFFKYIINLPKTAQMLSKNISKQCKITSVKNKNKKHYSVTKLNVGPQR